MSRVGKKPIDIPTAVKVSVDSKRVTVEGPKGTMEHTIPSRITVTVDEKKVLVSRSDAARESVSLHGLTQRIIANCIKGVTEGYTRALEIKGVGFKAQTQESTLQINLGFSHPVKYPIPEGITVTTPKPTQIVVAGIDKVKVGEVAAEIRSFYKPEPYTGKGIRYVGEYVRHKAGKTVVK
jgi:large subunit ribosomal protein L6